MIDGEHPLTRETFDQEAILAGWMDGGCVRIDVFKLDQVRTIKVGQTKQRRVERGIVFADKREKSGVERLTLFCRLFS